MVMYCPNGNYLQSSRLCFECKNKTVQYWKEMLFSGYESFCVFMYFLVKSNDLNEPYCKKSKRIFILRFSWQCDDIFLLFGQLIYHYSIAFGCNMFSLMRWPIFYGMIKVNYSPSPFDHCYTSIELL